MSTPVHSGLFDNPNPVPGVVWQYVVALPDAAPWLRIWFRSSNLDGDSFVRIASVLDGHTQELHQQRLLDWQNTTAFFNGNSVLIELVAGANSAGNFIELDKVFAGDADADELPPETICGGQDNRALSNDPRVARLFGGSPCTAFLIDVPAGSSADRLHLSASHCFNSAAVPLVEFNVPASLATCGAVHPPPAFQFPIDNLRSIRSGSGTLGDDWWVFACQTSSVTNQTTFQTQGSAFTLAASMPPPGALLRQWGHGLDISPFDNAPGGNHCSCANPNGVRNLVQQTDAGPLTDTVGSVVGYEIDGCTGNSGSPVAATATGDLVAIHTHGNCINPFVVKLANFGTAITHPALQAAIQTLSGATPAPTNDACAGALPLQPGINGPFSTEGATSGAQFQCNAAAGRDVWFSYQAQTSGLHVFDTCPALRNLDTVIELFSGTCGALSLLGCDDNGCGGSSTGSSIAATLTAGQTVFVRVGDATGAVGWFQLRVTPNAAIGDDCAAAIPVGIGSNGPFSNVAATPSATPWPCGSGPQNDVWFQFTASCTSLTTIRTCASTTNFDTVLQVFGGTCSALSSLCCNDDGCGLASSVTLPLVAAQSYLIRVGGYNGEVGVFDLELRCENGTGSIVQTVPGCGTLSLSMTGSPNLGGTVQAAVSGAVALPMVGAGFNLTPIPVCGCTFGHNWSAYNFGPTFTLTIPCIPSLIGAQLGLQGGDLGGTGTNGSCSPSFGLSDTFVVTIG